MYIVSIDIGIHNMGTVYLNVNDITWEPEILEVYLDNIQGLCLNCFCNQCPLNHEKCFVDYVDHYLLKYKTIFDNADVIIIERQPPTGFIVIQELILQHYRNKVKIIQPQSVHKFFCISDLNYDQRKEYTTNVAMKYLKTFETFLSSKRKHDISDALCQALYFISTEKEKYETQRAMEQFNISAFSYYNREVLDLEALLQSCKYVPN